MADEEQAPSSRKRVAGTQINKDNPEPDDDGPEQEMDTFKKATEEGADEAGNNDKISKDDTEKKDGGESDTKDGLSDEQRDADKISKDDTGGESEQKDADNKGQTSSATPLFSFKNLSSSQNAFTGLTGTGFSSTSFSFGSGSKDGSSAGPLFGLKADGSSFPFNLGAANNRSSATPFAISAEAPKKFAMTEGPLETGEENEKAVFTADSALYEYLDGGWKERGKGELKLNVPVSGCERAQLVMRTKGNYRLVLNASLYNDMSLKDMDKKGMTFACMNSIGESPSSLATFALKFKDTATREEFKDAVESHKTSKAPDVLLKTPDNSPKAAEV